MPLRLFAAILLTLLTLTTPASATRSAEASRSAEAPQPLIGRDFPDADLLQVDSTYYAYSTNSSYDGRLLNIPIAHASSITGPWTVDGVDALPTLPAWVAFDQPSGTYRVWAPDVSQRADGVYLMYYTAKHTSGIQCIGAATSDTPTGPFTPVGVEPLICNAFDHGNIDPASLVVDGRRYLVYKDDANSAGQPASVWIHETAPNGINWIGERHKLLTADPAGDERTVLDAPVIVRRDNRFVLFYSADAWDANYHVKYAVGTTLTAPFAKQGTVIDNTTWPDAIRNPGGQDVTGNHLAFHALTPGGRGLHVTGLTWRNGVPVLTNAPIVANGTYQLTALHSGKALDGVVQRTPTTSPTQRWTFTRQSDDSYRITNEASQLALTCAAQPISQTAWTGRDNQRWYVDPDRAGTHRITCKFTANALDVAWASTADNAEVITWPQHDAANQRWHLG
ncbi:family 43 glycosylhydrolase [Kribbella sp. NBC_01245]|uniref:family 43 glycosylhydrolase n=1 Tax=Kribbella sp. NBC_01245 TaxID=2903578 RepID=UPI002E2CF64C|nr:family 43 glycosylhydrolase [Kribbella sp. NBC_01245]